MNAISIGSRTVDRSSNTRLPRKRKPAHGEHRPEREEAQVERADELAVGGEHADALRRDRSGDRAEDADRGEVHDVARELQHRMRELVDELHDRDGGPLLEGRQCEAEEQAEDQYLQDLVGRHRLEEALREDMDDELAQRQAAGLEVGRRAGFGQRHAQVRARLEEIRERHAEQQRHH